MSKSKEITFEQALEKLEKASSVLDSDDITLEAALKSYEEGVKYYKECSEILKNAKQSIEVFQKDLED